MANNPKNSKLSDQFGDFVAPTESDLNTIEDGNDGGYYSPERIEDMRVGFSGVDADYTAFRNSKARTRGAGATDFETTRAADRSAAAVGDNPEWLGSEQTGGSKNTGNTSDFDAADTHGKYRGAGFGGMDVEAGPRASTFDIRRPRNAAEAANRAAGEWYIKTAGPTCNHPRCQALRARGMELWEPSMGSDRMLTERDYAKSTVPHLAIPSTRTDVRVAPMNLRPESENVPEGERVGSFGIHDIETKQGSKKDMGDFAPGYGKETLVPKTEPMDTKHPRWKALMTQYMAAAKQGDYDIFHPSDWLEHQHAPGEEFAPLPWES
jgi:hypothetical protein